MIAGADAVGRVTELLRTRHWAELSCRGETYLIQPENNKGWDYLGLWSTGSAAFCLARAFYDEPGEPDADAVRELLSEPCIRGESCLALLERGELELL